jgi:hypothetical protein
MSAWSSNEYCKAAGTAVLYTIKHAKSTIGRPTEASAIVALKADDDES